MGPSPLCIPCPWGRWEMPLWCLCSLLSLTDHFPATQSSPAASLGRHLPALCPTAPTALLQCPVHLHSPSDRVTPCIPCSGPHSPAHPNQCSFLTPAAAPLPSMPIPLAALSLPLLTLNCCPFPPHCLPTAHGTNHPLDTALSPTLCHCAGLHLKSCPGWVGRGPALAWAVLHTQPVPVCSPCTLCMAQATGKCCCCCCCLGSPGRALDELGL